jgi:hypothetical protein
MANGQFKAFIEKALQAYPKSGAAVRTGGAMDTGEAGG